MINVPKTVTADRLAVRSHGLAMRYGKTDALRDVEMTVPEHSFYVLVGPNGAGKTTLLKLLLGILEPAAGELFVDGLNPRTAGADVRSRIGYIPERTDDLYTWMSVQTALHFHRKYFPAWDENYAQQLKERLRIKPGRLSRLSKGEARRVQVVMALAHRPPLLLLDEPTDGLDPVGREVFLSILAEHIATTPTTVIVSTHLVYEMERLADHLAVLQNGRLITQLSREQIHSQLKRYVLLPRDESQVLPPPESLVFANGSERERAWTLYGDEQVLTKHLQNGGVMVREVRHITLEEAAIAFLSREDA